MMRFNENNSVLHMDNLDVTCEMIGDRVIVKFFNRCPEYKYFETLMFFLEICRDGRIIPTNTDWTRRCGHVKEFFGELSDDPVTQISYGIAISHLINLNGYPDMYGDILLDKIKFES